MPIVNYVREHIRFIEYASDEHVTGSERLVWYALMHIMNQRAQGNVWPDEFIRVSNERLLSLCPMKFDTMAAARNKLKQRGLIEFQEGARNKKSPSYRMIYFSPMYIESSAEKDGEACYTKKSYNMGDNMGDNIISRTWLENFGKGATPAQINDLIRRMKALDRLGYMPYSGIEYIKNAIREASLHNADSPIDYIAAMLGEN